MKIKLKYIVYTFIYADNSYTVEFHPVKKDDRCIYRCLISSIKGWHEVPDDIARPNAGIAHKHLRKYLKSQ